MSMENFWSLRPCNCMIILVKETKRTFARDFLINMVILVLYNKSQLHKIRDYFINLSHKITKWDANYATPIFHDQKKAKLL